MPAMLIENPESVPESALKSEMQMWASQRLTEHPGQRFPVERYQRLAEKSPEAAAAIQKVATDLLRESEDLDVLNLVVHLGGSAHPPFYQALLDRVTDTDKPLPAGKSIRFNSLKEEFLSKLTDRHVLSDSNLRDRVVDHLKSGNRHDLVLNLLSADASNDSLPDVIRTVLAGKPKTHQVALSAVLIGRNHSHAAGDIASVVADLPQEARATFFEHLTNAAPAAWVEQNGQKLRAKLRLE
jgi:hypothetical protein